jgi:PAS domain S-box-containing protein/putative nucleotidyltransferase with HDIG domain
MPKIRLENYFKNKTRIFILLIIATLIFALALFWFTYNGLYSMEKKRVDTQLNYSLNEINKLFNQIEKVYTPVVKDELYKLYDNQNMGSYQEEFKRIEKKLKSINKNHFKLNDTNYYLINHEGVIFKTNYLTDRGLDLKKHHTLWKQLEELSPGEISFIPFDDEVINDKSSLYFYLKLDNGDIFELGLVFKDLNQIIKKYFKSLFNNEKAEVKLISYPNSELLFKDNSFTKIDKDYIKKAIENENIIKHNLSLFKKVYYKTLSSRYGERVIKLTLDYSLYRSLFIKLIILILVILLIIILIIISFKKIIIKVIEPINHLAKNMELFSLEESDIDITQTNLLEIDIINKKYAEMIAKVNYNYKKLKISNYRMEEKNNEMQGYLNEIEEKDKLFRKVIDLSPNHIFIKDREGKFLLVNKTYANFFGITVRDLEGKKQKGLYYTNKRDIKKCLDIDQKVLQTGEEKRKNEILINKEGEERKLIITKLPIRLNEKRVVLGIIKDITDMEEKINKIKEQRNEIEASYEQLEAYNEEVVALNEDLEDSYQRVDKLASDLQEMIMVTTDLTKFGINGMINFLKELFYVAHKLVEIADYGSIYIFEEGQVEFIETVGHDLSTLQEVNIKKEIFYETTEEINVIPDVVSKTANVLRKQDREKFKVASKKIKESLTFGIVVDGKKLAGISLDIAQGSKENFNGKYKKLMKAFQTLAVSFYTINRYSNLKDNFKEEIILAIIRILELYDQYTKGHSENVAKIAKEIAKEIGLSQEDINKTYWAGLVHDIGKILISKKILNKPGRLTDEEYKLIKNHPSLGYEALSGAEHLKDIAKYILYHHERWDGSGYPEGLKEDQIPLISQILSVADAWDAMTSKRSYHNPFSKEAAIKEIEVNRGSQFSPEIADVFIKLAERTNSIN